MAAYSHDGNPMYYVALVVDCDGDETLIKSVLRRVKDESKGPHHEIDEVYKVYKTDPKRARKDKKDIVISMLATHEDVVYRFGKSLVQLHDSIKIAYDLNDISHKVRMANAEPRYPVKFSQATSSL